MHIWNSPQPLHSIWTWLQLAKPSSGDWILWEKALTAGLHLTHNQQLDLPLCLWNTSVSNKGWFFEPQSEHLWFKQLSMATPQLCSSLDTNQGFPCERGLGTSSQM